MTRNESMTARSPIITGGPYTVAISPPLPQGLNFEPSNGTIWGTPIFNQMPKTYSMNISNSTGYDNIDISIKIDDIPPQIVYDIENITLVRNWTIDAIIPSHQNGTIEFVQSSHSLPSGLAIIASDIYEGDISSGWDHQCTILSGSLWCWGGNYYGQLGVGSTNNDFSTPQLVDLGLGRTAVSVSLGKEYTCAILDDGSLKCWGFNNFGKVGIGGGGNPNTPQIVDLGVGRTAVSVSLGMDHTCALLDDGSLKCWGNGGDGRLGTGSTIGGATPQLVDLGVGVNAVSVSVGEQHTCAILDNGSLKCWGSGLAGALGLNSELSYSTPQYVNVGLGRTVTAVSLGDKFTCAILDDGSLKCWGDNTMGQMGVGSNGPSQKTPQSVDLGVGRTAISLSLGRSHVCVILDDNSLKCWGRNQYGQLGIGSSSAYHTSPQNVAVGQGIGYVSSGKEHTCVITIDGELSCWGLNSNGQLGIGTTVDSNSPQLVQTLQAPPTLAGSIFGTPTSVSPGMNYTFTANNTYGSSTDIIYIEVVPAYDYGNNTLSLVRNESMSTRSPIITGGPYTAVSIQPSLPDGLFFEPSNGSIWGTPLLDQSSTTYYISIANQTGSDTVEITIAISEIPPILEYDVSYMSYRRGFLSEHPVANLTGGAVAGFEISPALPAGLHFNTSSGIISGIPTTTYSLTTHTIWANNSFGSSSWDINFEVLPGIDNSYNSIYLTRNVTMPAYSPTINIDQITLSIQPPLPDGLSFDYQTAVISGTPLIPWTNTFYSIRLSNSTGEDWLNFTLEVEEILPNIYYPSSNLNLFNGYGFEPLRPIGDAGYPEIWAWNGSSVEEFIYQSITQQTPFQVRVQQSVQLRDYGVVCWGAMTWVNLAKEILIR